MTPELVGRLLFCARPADQTEGWSITWTGERLRLRLDPVRPGSCESQAELACGVAVGRLVGAADALGLRAEVRWRPETGVVADVTVTPAPAPAAAAARLHSLRRSAEPQCIRETPPFRAT